jgi:hypothetical protein
LVRHDWKDISMSNENQSVRVVENGTYTIDELVHLLTRDPDSGDWNYEAADRLVAEHRTWLSDPQFQAFIKTGTIRGRVWVGIDWKGVAQAISQESLHGKESDINILRIGANLAHYGKPVDLTAVLGGQSASNMRAILNSLLHSVGYVDGISDIYP